MSTTLPSSATDVGHDEVFITPRRGKRAAFGALLSRTLPQYNGPHTVGVCDVELPITPQTLGTFEHKNLPGTPAGITIDTVLFSLFYPSAVDDEEYNRVLWFPNFRQTIDGFLKMASRTPNFLYRLILYPLAAAAVMGTTFPALGDVPIKLPNSEESRWPLIIFSHGVGCSRLMYSALYGELASNGFVVAAVEHRDGTGPHCTITTEDGRARHLPFLSWRDLHWPELETQPPDDTILRHDQLKVRLAEIQAVIKAMNWITTGSSITPISVKSPNFDWKRWTSVDASNPVMCGHSLGGTAAFLAAEESDPRFDFRSVVVFDPAVQRIEPWAGGIACPVLCINSGEFFSDPDFDRTVRLSKTAKSSSIFTIAGATHPSFSDVFLILPSFINRLTGLWACADEVIEISITATLEFLRGNVEALRRRAIPFDARDDAASIKSAQSGRGGTNQFGPPGTLTWHI